MIVVSMLSASSNWVRILVSAEQLKNTHQIITYWYIPWGRTRTLSVEVLFLFLTWLHRVLVAAHKVFDLRCSMRDPYLQHVSSFSCGMQDLVPWPEMEPGPPALEAESSNHWISREVLNSCFLTAFPLFLHSLTSLISNCSGLFSETQGRPGRLRSSPTIKKQETQRGFCTWEGPTGFCSVSTPPFLSIQFSSVAQSCPTLCNPMDCSTSGFPVHHQLLELAQTHVHWVGNAIQPSLWYSSILRNRTTKGYSFGYKG